MSLYINTLLADAHRTQLIREAEVFRRGREARKSAAVPRKAHRRAATDAVAEPVAAAIHAAMPAVVPAPVSAGVYCRRAAAFVRHTASPIGDAW